MFRYALVVCSSRTRWYVSTRNLMITAQGLGSKVVRESTFGDMYNNNNNKC